MSSSPSLWPSYDSAEDADERVTADNSREPASFLGQLFQDRYSPADENEERERSSKATRSRRKVLSGDNCIASCTPLTKTLRTESQQSTPGTERSSNEESQSEAGSPFYGTGIFDIGASLSSLMKSFTTPDESALSPRVSNSESLQRDSYCNALPQASNSDATANPRDNVGRQRLSPDFSLRDTELEALLKQKKHTSLFAYGRILTIVSMILALSALTLSVVSRQSMSFVELDYPIEISPQLNLVRNVGLMKMHLCYNETANKATRKRVLILQDSQFSRSLSVEVVPTADAGQGVNHHEQHGCFVLELTVDTIGDIMWNVSRLFLSLAIAFGAFLTIMLCSATYWESINLKPIALGMLVTYFFQSLSFFFFDSKLCREYVCSFSQGSIASVFASLCWFCCALCCIRMDIVYQAQKRQWLRRRNRALKKIKLHRKASDATELSFPVTTVNLDDAQPCSPEPRNLVSLFDAEGQEWMDLEAVALRESDGELHEV